MVSDLLCGKCGGSYHPCHLDGHEPKCDGVLPLKQRAHMIAESLQCELQDNGLAPVGTHDLLHGAGVPIIERHLEDAIAQVLLKIGALSKDPRCPVCRRACDRCVPPDDWDRIQE